MRWAMLAAMILFTGCGPLVGPMIPRLDPESQQTADSYWSNILAHQPGLSRDQVEAEDGDRVRRCEGELVGSEAPQEERERERAHGEHEHGEAARAHGTGTGISRRPCDHDGWPRG